jgi:hypothetical protein
VPDLEINIKLENYARVVVCLVLVALRHSDDQRPYSLDVYNLTSDQQKAACFGEILWAGVTIGS